MLKLLLLILSLAVLWWLVRKDASEYAVFKRLTDTTERQRHYRRWVWMSFLALFGGSIVALLILRALPSLVTLPAEFIPLAARLGAVMPTTSLLDEKFLIGVAIGAAFVGILLGVLLARKLNVPHRTLGDVEPLLPRNGAETVWTALLSINAGLSEECFFRLLLPLLLVSVLHNLLLAFVVATLLFGLMHLYQGVGGVLMTTLAGAALAGLYLWTGDLWIAIAAHAGLDLFGFVIRPLLMRALHRPTA